MKFKVIVDSVEISKNTPVLDNSSTFEHKENVTNSHTIPITQPTELGESLQELNRDSEHKVTKMTALDMRSRLHESEVASILAFDALISLDVYPKTMLRLTTQKKRLAISLDGKGREEIVNTVIGKSEKDIEKSSGISGKFKSIFGKHD